MPSKSLKLPILAAFKLLTVPERTRVFLSWVRTQQGDYAFMDNTGCPLSLFGSALTGKPKRYAGHCGFISTTSKCPKGSIDKHPDHIQVVPDVLGDSDVLDTVNGWPRTYAALTKRLTASLKAL